MDLLTIKHADFLMTIECSKFNDIWRKAKNNIGEEALLSSYSWSDGVESVVRHIDNKQSQEIEYNTKAPAIFFDNAEYPIWVEFNSNVKKAEFGSILRSENKNFSFHRGILAGFLNYGNDIGRSEINLIYVAEGQQKQFTFSFEVLSTKLDYHEHWKVIIDDIEQEYRMLSHDYMKRTFHGFSPDQNGETPEIVWWSIFTNEEQVFIKACKNIIERPHHKLHGQVIYQKADRLKFIPSSIENELTEHCKEAAHLYRIEEGIQTNDTQENRFLKFVISQITDKYAKLKNQIEALKNISDSKKKDMESTLNALIHLQRNPFFRTVGRFKGINQESMVLQKATGYCQVYRTWNLLSRAYSLYDGIYKLQTKDIATLYEIWCFIEVSHIVKEQLKLTDEDLDHRNRMEMNGIFSWELGKGEHSRILFKKDNVELAELIYNSKNTENDNDSVGMQNLVVPTVAQKPDIVLQLTKNHLQEGMKMTYLFDAKYRIDGKQRGLNVDVPPEDSINQMHRYRDAIYYKDYKNEGLKKEVIGGYILFPGNGEPTDVAVSKFYKTIDEVNIGAFPLRPKDQQNRQLLEYFIRELIDTKAQQTIAKVIPQKGTFVDVGNRVLIGLVKPSSKKFYYESFVNGEATLYYTGARFPTTIPLHDLHFFIPYIKDEGIRDVYEIVGVRTITSKEAKQTEGDGDNDLRLAFELKFNRKQFANYQLIETEKMKQYTFIDTTFDKLDEFVKIDKI